jgi:hypothetical protein
MHELIVDRDRNANPDQRSDEDVAWIMDAKIDARQYHYDAETGPQQAPPS